MLLSQLASELGIAHLGVCARDVSTCEAALASGAFDHVQCPVNPGVPELAAWAARNCDDITIIANRRYGSGALLAECWSHRDLFRYSADHVGPGIVLDAGTNATPGSGVVSAPSATSPPGPGPAAGSQAPKRLSG